MGVEAGIGHAEGVVEVGRTEAPHHVQAAPHHRILGGGARLLRQASEVEEASLDLGVVGEEGEEEGEAGAERIGGARLEPAAARKPHAT